MDSRYDPHLSISLSLLKGLTSGTIRQLSEKGVGPEDFFRMPSSELNSLLGLNPTNGFDKSKREQALLEAHKELEKVKRHNIEVLFILDDNYPLRVSQTPDAPTVLYKLGHADLNMPHFLSVVGTRKPTPYGLNFTETLIKDLSSFFPDITIVSGLAYGIDACAHRAAIENDRTTVAVVAHGLDMIYPASHRNLAQKIIASGGTIISEYIFGEKPYRQRFLERNRIVAALSDATFVAESDIKGGAMSTANTAFSYSREVMVIPGRVSDKNSAGCNLLIRKEKARLITSASDLMDTLGWEPENISLTVQQRGLFPELEGKEKNVYDVLRFSNEPVQLDRIHQLTLIPMSELLALLAELEFDGVILRHPGNRFSPA